jgi:hypothetical protein
VYSAAAYSAGSMSIDVAKTMLKLALRLAEKGDAENAAEALRGALAMRGSEPETNNTGELRAVKKATLAELLECSGRHIDNLERKKKIPPEGVIGEGSGKRYIVSVVFAALGRAAPKTDLDRIREAARESERRRKRFAVVDGGKKASNG